MKALTGKTGQRTQGEERFPWEVCWDSAEHAGSCRVLMSPGSVAGGPILHPKTLLPGGFTISAGSDLL